MQPGVPAAGEAVWIRQRRWRVRRVARKKDVVCLDVAAGHELMTFLAPPDRASMRGVSGRRRWIRTRSAHARFAHLLGRQHGVRTLGAAIGARVDLLPHQLEPALAILHGAGRILIADAVGLGKTIQAGLVMSEILRRRPSARILVVVPATIFEQWRDELKRRFGLGVIVADRARLERLTQDGARGENAWLRPGVWLSSLDYLKQAYVQAGLPARAWDLVVFDEAHTACGESERHHAADRVARRARQVLLLTATPHDGNPERFARLMSLGRLTEDAGDVLTVFRRTRADVRCDGPRRVRWHRVAPSGAESALLGALAGYEAAVLAAAGSKHHQTALLLLSIFRKRAVSTSRALSITLERREAWLDRSGDGPLDWLQPSLAFDEDLSSDDVLSGEPRALAAEIGFDVRKERAWIRRLRTLATAAERDESKLARLVALLRRSPQPAVVFTEFRHSLEAAGQQVRSIRRVATLHGGQAPHVRAAELDRFLHGGASVLIATDVASLGLNLQHRSCWVIGLELPWNPARLEQRLGRVDRIGQTRPAHMTLLLGRHPAEAGVLLRLAQRTLIARRTLGDDALSDVMPDEARLREAVITGGSLDDGMQTATPFPVCRRWPRAARRASVSLARQRQFAGRWRAPDPDGGRTRVARSPLAPRDGAALIFSVPLLDAGGSTLEEHVIPVRISWGDGSVPGRDAIEAGRRLAVGALRARAGRVQRWLESTERLYVSRELAIAEAFDADGPAEAQPGLYDRRDAATFAAIRAAAADARAEALERAARWRSGSPVTAGRPVLALVLVPR